MDNIKSTAAMLLSQSRDFWVVEWYLDTEGEQRFHVGTYDVHIRTGIDSLIQKKAPNYHLLVIVDTQEQAIETANDLRRTTKIDIENLIECA